VLTITPMDGGSGTAQKEPQPQRKAMNESDDFSRLDDFTLLLLRQMAADNGEQERLAKLNAEVSRRTAIIRARLGGGR
jgi:hypothetical protein